MASNDKLAALYAAIDDAKRALADATEMKDFELIVIVETCIEGVREAAELYRESASSIEDGFGHSTFLTEEMNEHADELDSYADEIEDALNTVDEFNEEDARNEFLENIEDDDKYALSRFDGNIERQAQYINEMQAEFVNEKRGEFIDAAIEAINDVLGQCPL
jgi:hypothetical protein